MKHEELLHLLALINADGIGDVVAKKLISHCGSAIAIFKEKKQSLEKIQGIGTSITYALKDKTTFERAAKEIEFITKNNIEYSYVLEDDYPQNLKYCIDGPILFFKDGTNKS